MTLEPVNIPYEKRQLRKRWLLIAVVAHTVALITVGSLVSSLHSDAYNAQLLFILFAQQIVAFLFSVFAYPCTVTRLRDYEYHNKRKWTEYGITATLGTLAIYASSARSFDQLWLILLLIFLSSAEQLLGYDLDLATPVNQKFSAKTWYQFVAAWSLQIIEFVLVGAYTDGLAVPLYVVYLIMWSAFGVVCGLRLYYLKTNPAHWIASRWGSELLYTNLGWTSKFALVATGLPYTVKPFDGLVATGWIIATWCLVCTGFILYQTQQRASNLFTATVSSDNPDNETEPLDMDLGDFA